MKKYFKYKLGYIYYCFDLNTGNIERYIIHNYDVIKSSILFNSDFFSKNWFLNYCREISEIEFNSIFEL